MEINIADKNIEIDISVESLQKIREMLLKDIAQKEKIRYDFANRLLKFKRRLFYAFIETSFEWIFGLGGLIGSIAATYINEIPDNHSLIIAFTVSVTILVYAMLETVRLFIHHPLVAEVDSSFEAEIDNAKRYLEQIETVLSISDEMRLEISTSTDKNIQSQAKDR